MFFEAIGSLPAGRVEVSVAGLDDGVVDIGWDLLIDVTPRKWLKVPPDFDAVKRDWARWYLDEAATTLGAQTLLAMFVLADNDLPYETDADYFVKLSALVDWLRSSLAIAGFDVATHGATITDVTANLRSHLAELEGPAPRTLDAEASEASGDEYDAIAR